MTFDGGDGHIQSFGDVGGIEVLLITEDHHHARRFGERSDQAVEGFGEERVASGGDGGGFGDIGEGNLGTAIAAAGFIDGALDGHFAEPVGGVLGGLDGGEVAVEGEEDILSDLVGGGGGGGAVAEGSGDGEGGGEGVGRVGRRGRRGSG